MEPSEQLEAIAKMASRRLPRWLVLALVVLSFALLAMGLYTREPPYFMVLLFVAVVAYSAHRTGPHVMNAAQAAIAGEKSAGSVQVEVTRWSDSESFHAVVEVPSSGTWRFEFIPLGWQPVEGEHRATVFRLPGIAWPALVQVEQGVMYPRQTPEIQAK